MLTDPDKLKAHRRRWFHSTTADRHINRGMKAKPSPAAKPKLIPDAPEASDDT